VRESTLSASVDQKSVYKSKKPWTIHQEMQEKCRLLIGVRIEAVKAGLEIDLVRAGV